MSKPRPETQAVEDPHAQLEHAFIEASLRERGHSLKDLSKLPEAVARQLMTEASTYASARLAEVEARAHFVHEAHGGTLPL